VDVKIFTLIIFLVFLYVIVNLVKSIKLVPAQSEFIVERLGKYCKTLKAGFHLLVPFIEKVAFTQNLKERTIDVPAQQYFTKDEIQVEIDSVIYMKVTDSAKASYGITDYQFAAIQLAQTTTRAIIGRLDLDRTFEERESISGKVISVLDEAASKWGVKILRFEIKNLVPPSSVRTAMEKQVTAERNRRAILQKSIGEKESLINKSEGKMKEMINKSEGEKLKRINEAEGLGGEILSIGKATAESIRKMAFAINRTGGQDAIKLQLGQKYFDKISHLSDNQSKVVISNNLTDMNELLKTLGLDI
jgi:regulator of protease activity HflC (stomatin/prohibitin superfamily)